MLAIRALSVLAAWLAIFFLIAPFLYSFGFCFPRGDDFDEVTRSMFFLDLPGAVYEVAREWLTWSGRFSYHFLAVFLGKAGENRFLYGLICFLVLFSHFIGFHFLARIGANNRFSRRRCFFMAFIAMISVCVCHKCLPVFYLLTDALTSGLEEGAFLIFFACLARLYLQFHNGIETCSNGWSCCQPRDAIFQKSICHAWRVTLAAGIFAIGIYEHAALAVVCVSAGATVLAKFDKAFSNNSAYMEKAKVKSFIKLSGALFLALLASFLAPGNFMRGSARNVHKDQLINQINTAFDDWLLLINDFFHSPWPLIAVCVAFMFVLAGHKIPARPKSHANLFSLLVLAVFLPFSYFVVLIHALSDMPIFAAAKFSGNMEFFCAFAFGLMVYAQIGKFFSCFANTETVRIFIFGMIFIIFCYFAAVSANFKRTASNAANGQMVLLAEFMDARKNYLAKLAHDSGSYSQLPLFGLVGEIFSDNPRKRSIDARLPRAAVMAWHGSVFPVYMAEALASEPGIWPNMWAAWMYGLGAVKAVPPNGQTAVNMVLNGEVCELRMPDVLKNSGICQAWRFSAPGGENMTFNADWLIIRTSGALNRDIYILRPNPASALRLALPCLQEYWLERLLNMRHPVSNYLNGLAAAEMKFSPELYKINNFYAFPLGGAMNSPQAWPVDIFASFDGRLYHRLRPYL